MTFYHFTLVSHALSFLPFLYLYFLSTYSYLHTICYVICGLPLTIRRLPSWSTWSVFTISLTLIIQLKENIFMSQKSWCCIYICKCFTISNNFHISLKNVCILIDIFTSIFSILIFHRFSYLHSLNFPAFNFNQRPYTDSIFIRHSVSIHPFFVFFLFFCCC